MYEANPRFFSFALGAFAFSRSFFIALSRSFLLRARESKSAKARKKRRRPPLLN
jgi:hypothetical protein